MSYNDLAVDYSCSEANIALVASIINREYYMIFSNNLFFKFRPRCNWSNVLSKGSSKFMYDSLKMINGTEVITHRYRSLFNFISYIKLNNTLNYFSVMLQTDVYFCPWTPFYLKNYINHSILIIDVDEDLEIFYCLDPFFCDKKIIQLPFSHWKNNRKYYFLFFLKTNEWTNSLVLLAKKILYNIQQYKIFLTDESIKNDLKFLIIRFYHELISKKMDVSTIDLPFLRHLKSIERSRISYRYFLICLDKKYTLNLINPMNLCLSLSNMWATLRLVILRYTLKNDYENLINHTNILIDNIFIKEKYLCRMLTSVFDKE